MKHLLYTLIFVFSAALTQAQVTSISSINVGGSLSSGLSVIAEQNNYGGSEMTFLPTPAYSAGITFNTNWYKKIGIQIEGIYSFQGQKYYGEQFGQDVYKTVSLNYIQIPTFFKYTFTDYTDNQNAPDLFVLIGPQFSFLQNAMTEYEVDGTVTGFNEYHQEVVRNSNFDRFPEFTSDLELFNEFELSFVSALGASFDIGDYLQLTVESRLNWGYSDINAEAWQFPDLRNNYNASKNYLWGIRVGLLATVW